MDNGAHFYKCDFQTHTPRDKQWNGQIPQDDTEREAYAEKFVKACRNKGLQAVAITDHHDLAYFEYIKIAARNEKDDDGEPIPDLERLVVFPGIEITLGLPCQVLLILDADFPPSMLTSVLTALAIPLTDKDEPQCPQTVAQDHLTSLVELHELLDKHNHIKGKYIVLPNVGDGGHKTLLRTSFQTHYKTMPCVGGYVDGDISKLGHKQRIVDGKNREYGFKPIGVLATSDNRKESFDDLGSSTTWIKWAKPTAEALRQACLAKQTRISHSDPNLPSLWVSSIEVNQSKFMGSINLNLNQQYNCLIGGRGTGKSTVLEYLRWALCDQPPAFVEEDELPDFQAKRAHLIENTLSALKAVVTIQVEVNGVAHIVRRYAEDGRVSLKVGNGEFEDRTEQEVRSLLPLQAYSQKQLSSVGVRTDELVRFIKSPLKKELEEFSDSERKERMEVIKCFGQLRAKRELEQEMQRESLELSSLGQQEQSLKQQLKGLDENDQKILTEQDLYVQEEQIVNDLTRSVEQTRGTIAAAIESLIGQPKKSILDANLPNKSLLEKMRSDLEEVVADVKSKLDDIAISVRVGSTATTTFEKSSKQWKSKFELHEEKYDRAKQKASSQEKLLGQLKEVEERSKEIRHTQNTKKLEIEEFGSPEDGYERARKAWIEVFGNRADLLQKKCDELTELSGQRIRARIKRGTGTELLKEKLDSIISGTRIRSRKVDLLCEKITSSNTPIQEWEAILDEFSKLAKTRVEEEGDVELPDCPALAGLDFNKADLGKLSSKLTDEEWLSLSLIELIDVPVFEYAQREGDFIPFSSASAGQQATALLRVLLSQEGPPLIIDQPEEDLDNQVVLEIVEYIWKAKQHRQVIFSSHNANIVVNGDADLVACCCYRRSGDQSGGQIKLEGAIDVQEIRAEITEIMEGGRDAFRLRKAKYGF